MLQASVNKSVDKFTSGPVAQWITRLTTDQKIPGSNPGRFGSFLPNLLLQLASNDDVCRLN